MSRQKNALAWQTVSACIAMSAILAVPVCAQQMDKAAIGRLLEHKGNINVAQPDGTTALHWAAYQDDLDLVDKLLRAGANARAANQYGVTPLSLACTNGNVAMVERLLAA